jgi:isocitrate lyase
VEPATDPKEHTMTTTSYENAARPGDQTETAADIEFAWAHDPRWAGVRRDYTADDVVSLRGPVREERTLAERGAQSLWEQIQSSNGEEWIAALGALTGNQAVQQVRAGLKAIYLSGWQVAADANLSGQTYPDQSLYPVNSVPSVVRRINNALLRTGQIEFDGGEAKDWMVPIIADAEAGFGGPLNAYELMGSMIEAGAAGVHWEDQLASEKKCGHMGGKVLVPTGQHIRTLNAARLAADVAGTSTIVIARTDALAASLLTSDHDERDRPFLTGERTAEGFYEVQNGIEPVIARGLAYAEYADLLWVESAEPDLDLARRFAERIHQDFPDQKLAYNCSPSFNWKSHLDDAQIATFQRELAAMGYAFQFITLAGFHALNHSMFTLAKDYAARNMSAYVELQEAEFASEAEGYTATKHQREVGTGYFDKISTALNPESSTLALAGSTESAQFH